MSMHLNIVGRYKYCEIGLSCWNTSVDFMPCFAIDVPLCKAVKIGRDGIQVAVKRKMLRLFLLKYILQFSYKAPYF